MNTYYNEHDHELDQKIATIIMYALARSVDSVEAYVVKSSGSRYMIFIGVNGTGVYWDVSSDWLDETIPDWESEIRPMAVWHASLLDVRKAALDIIYELTKGVQNAS